MEIKKDKIGNEYVVFTDGTEIGLNLFLAIYKRKSLVDKKIGRLKVIKEIGRKHNYKNYLCLCDCGKETEATSQALNSKKKLSCGCLHSEVSSKQARKNFKKYNDFIFKENIVEILIKDKKVTIDAENFEKIKKHRWYINKDGYACSHINNKVVYLHIFLFDKKDDNKVIDHRNRNKLDNTKKNLKEVEENINLYNKNISKKNKSGYTGVRFIEQRGKYESYISYKKKRIFLGYFLKIEEAIKVRKEAEMKYYGFNVKY